MKIIIIILFLFSIDNTYSQSITLRVLGKSTYVQYAETNGVIISLNNNELNKKTRL